MQRIFHAFPLAILLLGSLILVGEPASAQVDNRALFDRMDRLERDIQVLNQNVARGVPSGGAVIRSPAIEAAPALPPGMASRLDVRVDSLEEQIRQLTGKVEEANYRAMQSLKQIERLQADIDLRFKDLEGGPAAADAAGAPGGPAAAKANVGGNAAEGAGGAPGPQILGSMPEKDLKKALAQPAAPQAPRDAPKDAQGLYDDAYGSAQRGDYVNAEIGFKAFLDSHPDHQLAGNASYWLGDIAFVKKDFSAAAGTFLEAYKKYPKHTKAPDMIFKAGAAFGQLGKKKEACTALGILFKEHPNMPDRVKRAATAERTKNECK